jgi:hypothetical protein
MPTTPIVSHGELVPVAERLFSDGERAALAGFLAGYSGLTREAYTLDLRQYMSAEIERIISDLNEPV